MCHVNTSNSSTSFKIGKGLRYNDSSGVLYVSIVSLDWGGGNSKGGKDCGIFKCGSSKGFSWFLLWWKWAFYVKFLWEQVVI